MVWQKFIERLRNRQLCCRTCGSCTWSTSTFFRVCKRCSVRRPNCQLRVTWTAVVREVRKLPRLHARSLLMLLLFIVCVLSNFISLMRWPDFHATVNKVTIESVPRRSASRIANTSNSTSCFQPRSLQVPEHVAQNTGQSCISRTCIDRGGKVNHSVSHTVVTAYFNLGTFRKGHGSSQQNYTTELYYKWLTSLGLLTNDLIAFSDDTAFLTTLRKVRGRSVNTCFCLLRRHTLWSFRLLPYVDAVLRQTDYPQHWPNTVVPQYAAAMHSKYAVLQLALDWDPFRGSHFSWLDVGLFRDLVDPEHSLGVSPPPRPHEPFHLDLPPNYDPRRVAVNLLAPARYNASVTSYFVQNDFWVGGGFFLATKTLMRAWVQQYRRMTVALLRHGLSDTDQQVLFAMFHPDYLNDSYVHPVASSVVLTQEFRKQAKDTVNEWFYLPYLCRQQWFFRTRHVLCAITRVDLHQCFNDTLSTLKPTVPVTINLN